MKTILISSFHSLISRNILSTDILPLLSKDNRVVVLVPVSKADYFKEHFEGENVIIEPVDIQKRPNEEILKLVSTSLVGIENLYIRGLLGDKRYLRYVGARIIHALLGKIYLPKKMLKTWYRNQPSMNMFCAIFETYKPDVIFSTDIYLSSDRELIKEAHASGIIVVGMVRSWDNVTTKGVLLEVPNHIIVHSNLLKEELTHYNHVDKDNISVTGIPHYDLVVKEQSISREGFFDSMNLDRKKKTILFSPAGKILYKDDGLFLSFLKHTNNNSLFNESIQFLVRFPPSDTADISSISSDPNFIVDIPGQNITGRRKDSELEPDAASHLNNSLVYSDIVMTYASTMIIDAAVFDKPTIVIAFNLPGAKDNVEKFATYSHLHRLFETGLCTIVRSKEELLGAVNTYLLHSDKDHEKRKQIAEKYSYKLDGKSGERAARVVSSFL